MTDFGRDELIDAKRERERHLESLATLAKAIEVLMDDRVRHLTALRQIALMTETGIIAKGGYDVHRIAREALEVHRCECGYTVPEGAWADGYRTCRGHLSDVAEESRFDRAAASES